MRRKPYFKERDFTTAERLYYDEGYHQKEIGAILGVGQPHISNVVNRKTLSREGFVAKKLAQFQTNIEFAEDQPNMGIGKKLTITKVRRIRRLYFSGDYSQTHLARMFDITQPTVHYIVCGLKWRLM